MLYNLKASKILVFIAMFTLQFNTNAQRISKDQIFYYYLKVWNINIEDEGIVNSYGLNCDEINYNLSNSDEFNRTKYRSAIKNIIKTGINNIDFTNKFTLEGTAEIGEYNFEENFFPIKSWYFSDGWWYREQRNSGTSYEIVLALAVNIGDFNATIKMNADAAYKFIQSRKNNNGKIDRHVFLKVTYSILDKVNPAYKDKYYFSTYIYSIDIYSDKALSKKLTTIHPKTEYFDKVHGIKVKDGEEIIFYDKNWQITKNKSDVQYYRIITYVDGILSNPVKDYYLSGKLQMEGSYANLYYTYTESRNGPFTWYNENGQKMKEEYYTTGKLNGICKTWHDNGNIATEVKYIDGQMDGIYNAWYPNGRKQNEVLYINGKKDGCEYTWEENGKCDYFDGAVLYSEGKYISRSNCKCINQN